MALLGVRRAVGPDGPRYLVDGRRGRACRWSRFAAWSRASRATARWSSCAPTPAPLPPWRARSTKLASRRSWGRWRATTRCSSHPAAPAAGHRVGRSPARPARPRLGVSFYARGRGQQLALYRRLRECRSAIVVHEVGGPEKLSFETVSDARAGGRSGRAFARPRSGSTTSTSTSGRASTRRPRCRSSLDRRGRAIVEAVGPGVSELAIGDRVAYAGVNGAYAESRAHRRRSPGAAALAASTTAPRPP